MRALGAALLTLVSLPVLAGTFTAFGPKTYTRDTSAPVETHYGFSVKNTAAPYRLRVENGAGSSSGKMVASAIIKINGVTILGTKDFNSAKADFIEAPITVVRTNDLSIELRSDPGSAMTGPHPRRGQRSPVHSRSSQKPECGWLVFATRHGELRVQRRHDGDYAVHGARHAVE